MELRKSVFSGLDSVSQFLRTAGLEQAGDASATDAIPKSASKAVDLVKENIATGPAIGS